MSEAEQPFSYHDIREAAVKRIPELITVLDSTIARVDPINLLCQFSVIKLSHASDQHPDTEEMGKWQAPLEYLAWRVLYRAYCPESPTYIDGPILDIIETALEELFSRASVVIMEPVDRDDELARAKQDVAFKLRMDALHVRGEGTPDEIGALAQAIYGPHDGWFLQNLGFTISDAVVIVRRILELISTKISAAKRESHERAAQLTSDFSVLVSSDPNTLSDEDGNLRTEIEALGIAEAAERAACHQFFSGFNDIASFSLDELITASSDIDPVRISAFLNRMSRRYGEPVPEPELLGFNPISERPLIRVDSRYFVPVPPVLYEALLSTYHFDLWRDPNYRATYDKARASWLEEEAIRSFQTLLPGCQAQWNLTYGPKKARKELDGLVLYDNKLILVECKWKTLTIAARQGDIDAAQNDVEKSIAAAYAQAARARDYIRSSSGPVEFTDETGVSISVESSQVGEIYLVSLLGRGAMSVLAVNLPALVPLGMFGENDFPWALPLLDLRIVCDYLEFPAQLFDYLRRRDQLVKTKRFLVHDEWDLLGIYLAGHLDADSPRFAGYSSVMLSGFDIELDRHLRSEQNPDLPPVPKPVRRLPDEVTAILRASQASQRDGHTDFEIALLSFPDSHLESIAAGLRATRAEALRDRDIHSASVMSPSGDVGLVTVGSYENLQALERHLLVLCATKKYRTKATTMLGVGFDHSRPNGPHALYFESGQWQEDPELERHLPILTEHKRFNTPRSGDHER